MSDREAFEEAASRLGYNLSMAEHETGEYHYRVTQDAWDIWREAVDQAAREQEGGEAVPIGRIICDEPDFYYGEGRHVLKAEFKKWLDKGTKLYTHPSASVPEKRFPVGGLDHGWRGKYNEGWNDCVDAMLATTPQPADDSLQEIANKVCGHAPEGWIISFCMENGAAWVEAAKPDGEAAELPDSANQTLVEQINDALCVAKGWINPPAEGGGVIKLYYGGCAEPSEFDFVKACFANNGKEAKHLMWKEGDLADECEGDWISARVIRKPEHDNLLGKDGRTDAHVIQDDATYREMGWMIDGDNRCSSCGLADYDGKWPVCEWCDQCVECGHDEDCETRHPKLEAGGGDE